MRFGARPFSSGTAASAAASSVDRPTTAIDPSGPKRDALPPPTKGRLASFGDRLGIGPLERSALGMWLLSRLGVLLLSWGVAWTSQPDDAYVARPWLSLWQYWDTLRYQDIAQHGYTVQGQNGSSIAFFPGYPGLLWLVHVVVRDWTVSGLLISLVSGGFAVVALARVTAFEIVCYRMSSAADLDVADVDATDEQGRCAVRDAVAFLVCAPAAIFLAAGYTEAPFLALALFGWLAARRGRWLAAGVLTACATAIRVNGLFVFAALIVMFLLSRPRGREWARGAWLLLAPVPFLGFMAYLKVLTGDWLAWQQAEASGWYRTFATPITALRHTWYYAFQRGFVAGIAWEYQLEIVTAALGLVLLVTLLMTRQWPEATYVGCSLGALVTSYYFLSLPRDMLLWWPMFAGLAVLAVRRPWVRTGYLMLSTPLMFVLAYLYLTGHWAG
jgi:hypothetical protein